MNALTPDEVIVIQMSLSTFIEDMTEASQNAKFPFAPSARKDLKSMLSCAKSALDKIASVSGHLVQIDPYKEGDED